MESGRRTRGNERPRREHRTDVDKDAMSDATSRRDRVADDQTVCNKAPELAEHQRLWEDDEPCDDGRSGRLDVDAQETAKE